ncbi:MAG: ABC transporter ATP-binding protein, partial [Candidatus Omnitrophica bacterium]|nr:ABC transporter ATP-binding protein [Candidatus Omnitrophota bacterium]
YAASLIIIYQAKAAVNNMRDHILYRYFSLGKLFFDQKNIAQLNLNLLDLPQTVSRQLISLQVVFSQSFSLIVYLVLMFIISWQITLIIAFVFGTLNILSYLLVVKICEQSKLHFQTKNNLNKKVFDILSCLPLVKSYNQEVTELTAIKDIGQQEAETSFVIAKAENLMFPLQDTLMFLGLILTAFILSFTASKIKSSQIANLFVFFVLVKMSAPAFSAVNRFKVSLAKVAAPIAILTNIFNGPGKNRFVVSQGKEKFTGLEKVIRFEKLTFFYSSARKILKDVSFLIEKGKITVVAGATGSGKSTINQLLLRFYDCPDSSIFIDQKDIKVFSLKSLRENISFVSQDSFLFNDTIANNMLYGINRKVSDEEIHDVLKKVKLRDLIERLPKGLQTRVGEKGIKLSGGEQQRVALARVLFKDAPIVILDEATSYLDGETEKFVLESILNKGQGKTFIINTHRSSMISRADRIIMIVDGRVVEQGDPDALLIEKGSFFKYWQHQISTEKKKN